MPADPYAWTEQDAISLRQFIAHNPKFLHHLQRTAPKIKGASMEERAMTGSEAKGRLDTIKEIESMQQDRVQDIESAFIEEHE